MMEIWKHIPDYDGKYAISTKGRVASCLKWHGSQFRILKLANKDGYKRVGLFKDGRQRYISVHRLVATTFIPNPSFLPMVNHKDENPSNNCVENLEWCDCLYNNNYGNARQKKVVAGIKRYNRKVGQYSFDGLFIREWDAASEAAKNLGLSRQKISMVCHGKRKTHGGFVWKHLEAK